MSGTGGSASDTSYNKRLAGASGGVNFDDFMQAFQEGNIKQDSDGNYLYTDQDGQTYNMSQAGLTQQTLDSMMQLVNPTKDLELANIYAEQYKLPSATEAEVAGNEFNKAQFGVQTELLPYLKDTQISQNLLDTAQNDATRDLIPGWATNKASEYDLSTAKNNMNLGLVDDEGAAIKSGYDTQISSDKLTQVMNQMGIDLSPAQAQAILSQYNLATATNESNQRLLPYSENTATAKYMLEKAQADSGLRTNPYQEAATISNLQLANDQNLMGSRLIGSQENSLRSGYDLNTAQNQSNQSLIPDSEAATRSGYNYTTAMNQGQTSLLPQRFAATGKYIDESLKGKSVKGAMDTASADVSMAYKGADEASRRSMSRMGVTPNANSFSNSGLEMAKANVAARTNARKTTEDENYRRLGAVALMP